MPVISMFCGVIAMMYYFDNRRHHEPRVHVQYGEEISKSNFYESSKRNEIEQLGR